MSGVNNCMENDTKCKMIGLQTNAASSIYVYAKLSEYGQNCLTKYPPLIPLQIKST